jgi:hypothetical protein
MRIIGELTGSFGARLSVQAISVKADARAAPLETRDRLCDGWREAI